MKQAARVYFVTELFQAIAPNAKRMRRETELCGAISACVMPLKFITPTCMPQNA